MRHFHTPRIVPVFLFALLAAVSCPSRAELHISLAGSAGYFILPDAVSGNVVQDGYEPIAPGPYVTDDGSATSYDQTGYRYRHQFGKEVAPNVGFTLGLAYFFASGFGLGPEFVYGGSVRDLSGSTVTHDSLGADPNSVIPHDYRMQTTESSDRMRVKHWTLGILFGRRWALNSHIDITAAVGIGMADYLAWFQIERNHTTTGYYQANGHQAYEEATDGEFTVFGIRYPALYLRPSLGCSYPLSSRVTLNADVKVPLSYIDKGYDWSDNGGMSHTAVFYPSRRFVAGNVVLNLGLGLHLGKRSGS